MARDDLIETDGTVVETLPNTMFRVDIGGKEPILCTLSGKLRMNYIRVLNGDSVRVAISPNDVTRGIIRWRNK